MKQLFNLSLLVIIFISCNQTATTSTTIAFGSCSKQYLEDQMWSEINSTNPDIFIFLGDNIYGESGNFNSLEPAYNKQKNDAELKALFERQPVIGTWDDHDYGVNGGKYFIDKDRSKKLFLDFMDIDDDHPINNHSGVYNSYVLQQDGRSVKFIMLDTRYFRDTIYRDTVSQQGYLPNQTGTILGDEQWNWLENELTTTVSDVIIIGSSIQVLSASHPYEKWSNFPQERKRLLNLLQSKKNTILLSGDRHIAEISRMDLESGNTIYDFTASGLTHTWEGIGKEVNDLRIGDLIIERNFGVVEINWPDNLITFKVMGKEDSILLSHTHQF